MSIIDSLSKRFVLDRDTVQKKIFLPNLKGCYVLYGCPAGGGKPYVYAGRSLEGLQERLLQHIDNHEPYRSFKYFLTNTDRDAYDGECRLYHYFAGSNWKLMNKVHPAVLKDGQCWCPICEKKTEVVRRFAQWYANGKQ